MRTVRKITATDATRTKNILIRLANEYREDLSSKASTALTTVISLLRDIEDDLRVADGLREGQ